MFCGPLRPAPAERGGAMMVEGAAAAASSGLGAGPLAGRSRRLRAAPAGAALPLRHCPAPPATGAEHAAGSGSFAVTPEVLSLCLDYLPLRDLERSALVSRRFAAEFTAAHIHRKFLPVWGARESEVWTASLHRAARELREWHTRSGYRSLISAPVCSSTTDGRKQTVYDTVNNKESSFWSSAGSPDSESDEYLVYRLSGAFALARRVKVVFYQADYQQGAPVYYPQRIRLEFGWYGPEGENLVRHMDRIAEQADPLSPDADPCVLGTEPRTRELAAAVDWECIPCRPAGWQAGEQVRQQYAHEVCVARTAEEQVFELPFYVPACFIRVCLVGKVTRQAKDSKWYCCVQRLSVHGIDCAALPPAAAPVVAQLASGHSSFRRYLAHMPRPSGAGRAAHPVSDDPRAVAEDLLSHRQHLDNANPGLCYADQGVDTQLQAASRRFNLLTDRMVRRYGIDFVSQGCAALQNAARNDSVDAAAYAADMQAFLRAYEELQDAVGVDGVSSDEEEGYASDGDAAPFPVFCLDEAAPAASA
eukprot:TRINITY_DN6900_c1_g1_i1.p1 TRINITY_DN6900_c1_g1~~TRINITY_DN6900_c1_g1_i1.p1  ORF type:complete len:533 (+),score=150.59 TRINITY_DN6900_c1_g1_i1:36-1634(+)